ncbi:metallophosphoesterase [Carboxylicivirga sp. N1Y90]|uniref:metallophosphoesterase n=1 Tax=Carboxylicivirga fragile TaxID=3417571 RepID=UPI003D34DE81|nr:metallophosphoesterase [Marinilabiliaceae bacterium N1Y90]
MITRRKFIKKGILGLLGLFLLDSLWFEKSFVKWKEIDLRNQSQTPIKLIQLSDLHFKGINRKLKKIAEKINSLNPDLVVFTGDSIDSDKYLRNFDLFLKLIDPQIRKFAITGNWEYWGNVSIEQLRNVYAANNCELLINENRQINVNDRDISIIGIDDYIGGSANFIKAYKNIKVGDKTIVLSHCPAYADIIKNTEHNISIDLILSGHTHGGQINLFGFIPFIPQGSGEYISGLYDKTTFKLYVSKGVGTSILPIRFGARSEITMFNL